MKQHYILTLSLLATAVPTTYVSCHPTVIISADNIRTDDNLETKIKKQNAEKQETPPVQHDTEKRLY